MCINYFILIFLIKPLEKILKSFIFIAARGMQPLNLHFLTSNTRHTLAL